MSLLQRELGRPGERRNNVGIERDVSEREGVFMSAHLECRLYYDQSAPVLFNNESIDYRVHANAGDPHHARGFDLSFASVVLEGQSILHHTRDPRSGVCFDTTFVEFAFHMPANLVPHARHEPISHLDDDHSWLPAKPTTFDRVAQQVGHFG